MKKLIMLLIFSINSLFGYSGYYAPYEGTRCITQGWNGGYSHGITNGERFTAGTKLAYALDISGIFDVLAVKDGEVIDSGWHSGFGNYIVIKHNDGLYSQYTHLQKKYITSGDVKRGMKIGKSGNTGSYSAGNHLHLQFTKTTKLITDLASSYKVDFQGFSISEVNELNSISCGTNQMKTSKNKIYVPNNDIITSNKSIFDGAGSLVSPNEECWGCDKDEAIMHPHSGENSTVVFQWLYKNSCSQIDIHSNRDIGDVIIRAKGWNDHKIKVAEQVKLSSSPITVRRPNRENSWTTLAITTTQPLEKEAEIYAYCKDSSSSYKDGGRSIASKDLVDMGWKYYWSGTGSIISQATKRGSTTYGIGKDLAVTLDSHKSLTSFQWDTTSCQQITITDGGSSSPVDASIDIKGWSEASWETVCHELPCTIDKSAGNYYILKIKSDVGAITQGEIKANCTN